jgi:alanyl-tRNA synthetase
MKPLSSHELRQRYLDFFVKKYGHAQIPSSSVIPENDPTVLFTTAGMHPLVPYLMGEAHPSGKRLVDAQKCIRTDDIDEVGDSSHCTFFEMMGNWSLGDYFKKEAIEMSFEFLTGSADDYGVELDPKLLYVTVFRGDSDAPKDEESIAIWKEQFAKIGIGATEGEAGEDVPAGWRDDASENAGGARIFAYEKKKNWWGPAGQTGPCGPDTEMFYLVRPDMSIHEEARKSHPEAILPKCHPNCDCGRFVEIWNDVFMQYHKTADGKFEPLVQKNVDTGLGLERVAAILQSASSIYETEIFSGPMRAIENAVQESLAEHLETADEHPKSTAKHPEAATQELSEEQRTRAFRIILDHLRASVFILGDRWGVAPSNTDQGYILRRLIRRAVRCGTQLGIAENFTAMVSESYIDLYKDAYPELLAAREKIHKELDHEETRFRETLIKGEKEFQKQMEPFKVTFVGEKWLVTILQWFNLLKQAFDTGSPEVKRISDFLAPKMKDVQMIIRGAGPHAGLSDEQKNDKLFALFSAGERDSLQEFLNTINSRNFQFSGKRAFYFYETFGFPKELIAEMLREYGLKLEGASFDEAFKSHQELSRAGADQKFAGGLADHSEECMMLHTATHLSHQALRTVLGPHVFQKGSNITRERMRFDFSHTEKMTPQQIAEVERLVNDAIVRDLPVHFEILDVQEAKRRGAIGIFDDKYATLGNKVKVYFIGDFSKEVCGGPHVEHTGILKSFKITKEEAVSDGVRRIKAVVGRLVKV